MRIAAAMDRRMLAPFDMLGLLAAVSLSISIAMTGVDDSGRSGWRRGGAEAEGEGNLFNC